MELWGYTAWLTLDKANHACFEGIIRRIARVEKTMPFEPHLTLCGGLLDLGKERIVALAHSLGSMLGSIEIQCEAISTTPSFYQCLFAEVTSDQRLVRMHEKARRLFGSISEKRFLPHVSLAYGQLPECRKRFWKEELTPMLPVRVELTGLSLVEMRGTVNHWRVLTKLKF